MTLKIELPDEVRKAILDAFDMRDGDVWTAVITAALEALVKCGMATHMDCTDADDQVRPVLLIRLDGGKK